MRFCEHELPEQADPQGQNDGHWVPEAGWTEEWGMTANAYEAPFRVMKMFWDYTVVMVAQQNVSKATGIYTLKW